MRRGSRALTCFTAGGPQLVEERAGCDRPASRDVLRPSPAASCGQGGEKVGMERGGIPPRVRSSKPPSLNDACGSASHAVLVRQIVFVEHDVAGLEALLEEGLGVGKGGEDLDPLVRKLRGRADGGLLLPLRRSDLPQAASRPRRRGALRKRSAGPVQHVMRSPQASFKDGGLEERTRGGISRLPPFLLSHLLARTRP